MHTRAGLRPVLACTLACTLACATIDTSSEVTVLPRGHAKPVAANEQLVARDFIADYVQIGSRLSVEIRELRSCVMPRHAPVTRVEHVRRSTRGFVAWDFTLGVLTGGFSALAFSRPRSFVSPLIDDQGRQVYDYGSVYIIGGMFAAASLAFLATGIVDAIRSRNTTHYADAYTLKLGPEQPCVHTPELELRERNVELRVGNGALVLAATTDEHGRVRFDLPEWPGDPPASGQVPAVIEVERLPGDELEPRVLVFSLWVPYGGVADVQAGVADTRRPSEHAPLELGPVEGPLEPDPDAQPEPLEGQPEPPEGQPETEAPP